MARPSRTIIEKSKTSTRSQRSPHVMSIEGSPRHTGCCPHERGGMRMPNVIYGMGGVSADGYIAGPDGRSDWSMPDAELHRFHNEQTRALAGHLLGRRLYETMVYWETADKDHSDIVREFALIWQALPKVVFSRTLDSVEGANTTLARDDLRAALTSLQGSVGGDVG